MKRLILLASLSVLAIAQQTVPPHEVSVTSESVQNDGSVRHCSGHVVIQTDAVTVRTERADYNVDTNSITTFGRTTIELAEK